MLIIVGGHSRNIGKTSVVCGVIRALNDRSWTAVKITQYGHGVCSRDGEACECADPVHPVAASQECGANPATDSGRFLAAGAARAWWVRTPAGRLNEALPRLRQILDSAGNVIIESNSVLRFLKPDVCAMVLDGAVADFKPSSRRFLDRAGALVTTSTARLEWADVSPMLLGGRPLFHAPAPSYESDEFIQFIRRAALKLPARSAGSSAA